MSLVHVGNRGWGRVALVAALALASGTTPALAQDAPEAPECADAGISDPDVCGALAQVGRDGEAIVTATTAEVEKTKGEVMVRAGIAQAEAEGKGREALLAPPYRIWTSINDGTGSGLDADALDGRSAEFFLDAIAAEALARKTGEDAEAAARVAADEAIDARAAALERRAASLEDRAGALEGRTGALEGRALATDAFVNGGRFRGSTADFTGRVVAGSLGVGTTSPQNRLEVIDDSDLGIRFGVSGTHGKNVHITDHTQPEVPFGYYPGLWTPALMIQSSDNSRFLWMSPLDKGSGAPTRIVAGGAGLEVRVNAALDREGLPGLTVSSSGDVTAYGHLSAHNGLHVGDVAEPVVGVGLEPGDVVVADGFDAMGKLVVKRVAPPATAPSSAS